MSDITPITPKIRYEKLLSRLCHIRRLSNGNVFTIENQILEQMDDAWRYLTSEEQDSFNKTPSKIKFCHPHTNPPIRIKMMMPIWSEINKELVRSINENLQIKLDGGMVLSMKPYTDCGNQSTEFEILFANIVIENK